MRLNPSPDIWAEGLAGRLESQGDREILFARLTRECCF